MKKKCGSLAAVLLLGMTTMLARAQIPALTAVQDTVYKSDGTLATGSVVISWPPFVTADSKPVFGGTKTVTLSSGALAVALTPNAGGSPSGTSYNVKYFQSGGVFFEETWVVPASLPLADPAQVVSVTQAGTPGAVTYYYWCTGTNGSGETLLSPSRITTASHATLDGTNYNIITCATVSGATGYKAYRTTTATAPSGTGLFLVGSSATTVINDQSNTLTAASIPSINTTDPKTLSAVRILGTPSPSVEISAVQVSGTAIVASPAATQAITAPATAGVKPLQLKGNVTAAANIFEIYDSAASPVIVSWWDSNGLPVTRRDQNAATRGIIQNQIALGNTSAWGGLQVDSQDSSGLFGAFPSDFLTGAYQDAVVLAANSTASRVVVANLFGGGTVDLYAGSATLAAQLQSTGRFQSFRGTTVTAPATAGQPALQVKGNVTAAANVIEVYDSAVTQALISYFDVNGFMNTAGQITSSVGTGTAPFSVTSTTVTANLNADLLDGLNSTVFPQLASANTFTVSQTITAAGGALGLTVDNTSTASAGDKARVLLRNGNDDEFLISMESPIAGDAAKALLQETLGSGLRVRSSAMIDFFSNSIMHMEMVNSNVRVPDGVYFQVEDNNAGAPAAADCDADGERGRQSIDTTSNRLYICNGATRGWDFIALTD